MKRILVGVDYSDVSDRAVASAMQWAADLKAAVHLLHVIPPAPPLIVYASPGGGIPVPTATLPDTRKETARLKAVSRRLRRKGVEVGEEVVEGHVIDEILAAAERVDAEAIVVGSHGHSALYELLVGSVTEGILRRTRRPVWVVPSRI